jgi:hypothetical protein
MTNQATDEIQKNLEELDSEIARLQAEQSGLTPVPSWEELQDAGVIQQL